MYPPDKLSHNHCTCQAGLIASGKGSIGAVSDTFTIGVVVVGHVGRAGASRLAGTVTLEPVVATRAGGDTGVGRSVGEVVVGSGPRAFYLAIEVPI